MLEETVEGSLGEQLIHVFRAERSGDGSAFHPFVLIDLRALFDNVRGGDRTVPALGEAASELASEEETQSDSGGRGLLSWLFFAGVALGLGYVVRTRTQPPEEAAEETADETQAIAERAASVIQRRGEVAATRIEEGSEAIADRIEETGEETADSIEEAGEQIEEAEQQAEEKAENVHEEAEEKMQSEGDDEDDDTTQSFGTDDEMDEL